MRFALLLAPLCVVVACSHAATIDASDVQTVLLAQASKSLPARNPVCPDDVRIRVGATFTCTVLAAGTTIDYTVTIDRLVGGKAHFVAVESEPVVDTSKLVAAINGELGPGVTTDCGARIQQVPVGHVITCTSTNGQQTKTLEWRVGADGTVTGVGP